MHMRTHKPPRADWSSGRVEAVVQGDFRISRDTEVVLSTILGSCVSACLFDPGAGIGGMNHFLLPGDDDPGRSDVRYGVMAMELLINGLLKAGARRGHIKAKLFGGGRVSSTFHDIGDRNVIFARSYLQREGFEIASESLGGRQARRLHFRPATGAARMVLLPPAEAPEPVRPARRDRGADQDITLF